MQNTTRARAAGRTVVLVIGAAALLTIAWVAVVVNPFEWGAEHSTGFSWENFNAVQPGQSIGEVVATLGDPIKSPTIYAGITGNGRTQICSEFGRCRQYQFAGVQLVGGREAVVIADARTGTVIATRINYEP